MKAAVEKVCADFGRIDILFANAGAKLDQPEACH